ncbi:uncharacterized protein PODANS_1_23748 [Podospora anserina S mat+]|uniref:Podospora anserina S mat+ genomic DNA chromosome 1, supercontig 6 n=1 Tax=Podospora anserina (strain S / ATCC MYA-4624 / DSM 980 / FGSC 10383) TaxID=515849 RepID=B2ASK0_PODAN|nr:uncharacterized protein PODANS_1_23748 [Podospora anserina S mat+]CAP67373.1 unnamed protein product [Podospora anserina S mat+]CDP24786.1 Putative protein of unknown function [Podospora anserina S mat+]
MSSSKQQEKGSASQLVAAKPAQAIPAKRTADDDEVEFISCCPVKKPRLNDQPAQNPHLNDQKPDPAVSRITKNSSQLHQASASHRHASDQPAPPSSVTRTTDTGPGPSQDPSPRMSPEQPSALIPVLESFAFPTDFPPISRVPRMSVAVSPKQMSQPMPSTSHPTSLFTSSSALFNSTSSPCFEQVPCLDFGGITMNNPAYETGQMLSPSDNNALITSSTHMSSQMINQAAFGPNAIPFAMYSMGSLVPMPQQNMNLSMNSSPNPWMNPRPMQSQGPPVFRPHNPKQEQQPRHMLIPPGSQSTPGRPCCSTSVQSPIHNQSPCKPPGLHCTVVQQEHMRWLQQAPLQPSSQPQTQISPGPPPPPPPPPPQLLKAPTTAPEKQPPNKTKFTIPLRKKPSPNLLIDIAETAEETFPYDEVAARHGVTPQKVFDTLSAIVLIPLLRCPTDKRRAGKLAHDRVKFYTQKKNTMGKEKGEVTRVKEVRQFLEEENRQQGGK